MGLPHRSGVWAHSGHGAEDPVPPINVCLSSPRITRAHYTAPCGQSTAEQMCGTSWEHEESCEVLPVGGYETTNSHN